MHIFAEIIFLSPMGRGSRGGGMEDQIPKKQFGYELHEMCRCAQKIMIVSLTTMEW